jgi:hypothetical protein
MINMGGFEVRQPLPSVGLESLDPFLLLHHADVNYKNAVGPDQSGVGPHPHRGFSPVSFVFKGGVHHRDSLGNDSVIYAGGVQWINSGSGIIHSERPPLDQVGTDSPQEFIQLWVNTPSAHKMDSPTYQPFRKDEIPVVMSKDGLIRFKVVAGDFLGQTGPVETDTEVMAAMIDGEAGGKSMVKLSPGHHAMLYLLNGEVKVNGEVIAGKNLIVFENEGDGFDLETLNQTDALLLSGAPLNEPISKYGPFVMNTQREIIDALNDAQSGKMGVLNEIF